MHDWEKPHITKEDNRYFFTRPISETIGEKIDVTADVQGWINRAHPQPTALEVAKLCLQIAMTGTHNPMGGEVRRAIVTIFGPEIDAQLQADLLKPL